jgi:hypothetical protein
MFQAIGYWFFMRTQKRNARRRIESLVIVSQLQRISKRKGIIAKDSQGNVILHVF